MSNLQKLTESQKTTIGRLKEEIHLSSTEITRPIFFKDFLITQFFFSLHAKDNIFNVLKCKNKIFITKIVLLRKEKIQNINYSC